MKILVVNQPLHKLVVVHRAVCRTLYKDKMLSANRNLSLKLIEVARYRQTVRCQHVRGGEVPKTLCGTKSCRPTVKLSA